MSEEHSSNSNSTESITTPSEWNLDCQCSIPTHKLDDPHCGKDTRWLNFKWFFLLDNTDETTPQEEDESDDSVLDEDDDYIEDSISLLMLSLSHTNPLTAESVERIFGLRTCGIAGTHLSVPFKVITRDLEVYPGRDTASSCISLKKALEFGYPALPYLYELYSLKKGTHPEKIWKNPAYQSVFLHVLQGINCWARHLLNLSPEDLHRTFMTDMRPNPHIRMGDLSHLQHYCTSHTMGQFLSGPAWNCSLEYLLKLSLGLLHVHDFFRRRETPSEFTATYNDTGNSVLLLLKKILEGHVLIHEDATNCLLEEDPQLPSEIANLIQDFSRNEDNSANDLFLRKTDCITVILNKIISLSSLDTEESKHPEPSPSPPQPKS